MTTRNRAAVPHTLRSARNLWRIGTRRAGGPSVGFSRVTTEIAAMKPATVSSPGMMPARNSAEMLVSVKSP